MANVRVTCPTCNAELEIGEEHLGKEVECGSCLAAFVAEDPKTKKQPYKMRREEKDREDEEDEKEDRPRKKKRRRRRRDDDDGDDYDYSPPGTGGGGGTGLATTSMILGILSVLSLPFSLCCCFGFLSFPLSLGAIVTGAIALKQPAGKGMAITGLILGFLTIAISILFLVVGFGGNAANFNRFGR